MKLDAKIYSSSPSPARLSSPHLLLSRRFFEPSVSFVATNRFGATSAARTISASLSAAISRLRARAVSPPDPPPNPSPFPPAIRFSRALTAGAKAGGAASAQLHRRRGLVDVLPGPEGAKLSVGSSQPARYRRYRIMPRPTTALSSWSKYSGVSPSALHDRQSPRLARRRTRR